MKKSEVSEAEYVKLVKRLKGMIFTGINQKVCKVGIENEAL